MLSKEEKPHTRHPIMLESSLSWLVLHLYLSRVTLDMSLLKHASWLLSSRLPDDVQADPSLFERLPVVHVSQPASWKPLAFCQDFTSVPVSLHVWCLPLFLLPSAAQLSCHSGGPISCPSFLRVHVSMPLWQEWPHSHGSWSSSEGLSHRA